ncbi:S8 family serine peptidase [Streptomyces sp. DSM 41931]|uniref:cyanobactin maturation protease PatG family protein n=1 Tax=Streptomyces sp. DSM 41931 TaxID=3418367 RepID=UPI003D05BB9B
MERQLRRRETPVHPRSILSGLPSHWTAGDAEVRVAVIDGPVDLSHPCFAGADLHRLDTLVGEEAGPGPMSVHGTHVTSLLFAQHGHSVTGLAPRCRGLILPVFREGRGNRVSQLDLARAIERAVDEGAHIVNISGGERSKDGKADLLLDHALELCQKYGVLVVAAVGNDGCDCLHVPAAAQSVLGVGAAGPDGEPLESNNWGDVYQSNAVLAPGQDIVGATPSGGFAPMTGSSFATPLVTGVAALLMAAQLRDRGEIDPLAAGQAVLKAASYTPCGPDDAPECRRQLAGRLDAAQAFRLIAETAQAATATAPVADTSESLTDLNSSKGAILMASHDMSPTEGASATTVPGTDGAPWPGPDTDPARQSPASPPPIPPDEDPAAATSAPRPVVQPAIAQPVAPDIGASVQPMASEPGHNTPHPGARYSLSAARAPSGAPSSDPVSGATGAAGTYGGSGGREAITPDTALAGVVPSCGGTDPAHCPCHQNSQRPLVYAIGTIGYDFRTEAIRDGFRQLMPAASYVGQDGVPVELPADPYNPNQLYDYLVMNPSANADLTWTMQLEGTNAYALEAQPSVGMDSYPDNPDDPVWDLEELKKTVQRPGELATIINRLALPPVNRVYRLFREAIVGQVKNVDDPAYVSRVSIPGVLTDRTVQTFSGDYLPVLTVDARAVYTWNEGQLVSSIYEQVAEDTEERNVTIDAVTVKKTIRSLLDKMYYQFLNLGQSSPDRALNYAATNAFLIGGQISEGLLSAKYVPGPEDRFYALDGISVEKSPYCRSDADCQLVKITFFDPENNQRSRVTLMFTVDVSAVIPVVLAGPRIFLD